MELFDRTFLIHYWGGIDEVADHLEANAEHEFLTTTRNSKDVAVGRALQGTLYTHEIRSTFD